MQIAKRVRLHAMDVIVLLGLAGCAHFEARPLAPDQTAAQFDARTLDDPGLRKFLAQNLKRDLPSWPRREWDFETLTLVALYYHPSLDVARARWAVAQASVRTAGQRPNPAVNAAPQYTTNSPSGESPWVAALTFEGVIETAGKRGYRVAQAQQLSEAARLNLAAQAWQVRSGLRTSLLNDAVARRRLVLQQNVQETQQQTLGLLEARLRAGDIAATDLITPRVAWIRAQADLADARRQAVDSRAAVAQALGLPLQALEARALQFDLSPTPEVGRDWESAKARRRALHRRADVLAALANYAASQSTLQLEIAKQYPDIRLGPGYEFDQGLHKWGLAVGTDFLPVFHRNQGPIAEAQAKRAEAAARFLALQAQVSGEIDRALAARAAAQDQLRQLDALLEVQRKRVESVAAMVQAGAADQLELRTAELEVATTELARLDAAVKAQQALGQLEDAVQVPFEALPSVEQEPRAGAAKENKP